MNRFETLCTRYADARERFQGDKSTADMFYTAFEREMVAFLGCPPDRLRLVDKPAVDRGIWVARYGVTRPVPDVPDTAQELLLWIAFCREPPAVVAGLGRIHLISSEEFRIESFDAAGFQPFLEHIYTKCAAAFAKTAPEDGSPAMPRYIN
jgi:hypothetical protein